jgi:uncharacterized membrane protein
MTVDVLRIAGVLVMLTSLILLVAGTTALDCLVVAVVGFGLSRVGAE